MTTYGSKFSKDKVNAAIFENYKREEKHRHLRKLQKRREVLFFPCIFKIEFKNRFNQRER